MEASKNHFAELKLKLENDICHFALVESQTVAHKNGLDDHCENITMHLKNARQLLEKEVLDTRRNVQFNISQLPERAVHLPCPTLKQRISEFSEDLKHNPEMLTSLAISLLPLRKSLKEMVENSQHHFETVRGEFTREEQSFESTKFEIGTIASRNAELEARLQEVGKEVEELTLKLNLPVIEMEDSAIHLESTLYSTLNAAVSEIVLARNVLRIARQVVKKSKAVIETQNNLQASPIFAEVDSVQADGKTLCRSLSDVLHDAVISIRQARMVQIENEKINNDATRQEAMVFQVAEQLRVDTESRRKLVDDMASILMEHAEVENCDYHLRNQVEILCQKFKEFQKEQAKKQSTPPMRGKRSKAVTQDGKMLNTKPNNSACDPSFQKIFDDRKRVTLLTIAEIQKKIDDCRKALEERATAQ